MKPTFWCGAIAALLALPACAFDLHSRDVRDGGTLTRQQVFQGFGCEGGNQAPQLNWAHAPAGTKSFAITVYDPDAPTGSGWWHWVAYDIPATVTTVDGGVVPAGAHQGRNDYGTKAFGGACPPPGDKPHRYIFTVHALKVEKLEVPEDASSALIGYMINANRIGKATLTAKYGR